MKKTKRQINAPNGQKVNPIRPDQKKRAKILPSDFFSKPSEKTKLNWFLFEYAFDIQSRIDRPLQKKLKRKGIGEADIAEFCRHYAKEIKQPILDKLSGKAHDMVLSHEPIEEFFPSLNDKLINELLAVAAKAWEGLMEICVSCPNRCISEKDEIAPLFDDPYYHKLL